ncbi:hypothetical protein [Flavobacterium sp. 3HN19-14]|uniref:hypothetical protein n=1 Tax=Flavobacterium sp. 3HN19-14 TaxID=3448133 RepID=UPI003EE0DFD6
MKTYRQNLAMLSAVIAFGCHQRKADETKETDVKTEQVTIPSAQDTIKDTETPAEATQTVEGKVQEIMNGKDGYTAKIETADKEVYFVTISHSNLNDHTQYKSVKVGETLKVTGDSWATEGKNQITVRSID